MTGSAPLTSVGTAVSPAGDINLDGFDDVLVGVSGADDGLGAGVAWYGSAGGMTTGDEWVGDAEDGYFGWDLAGLGDVDGDDAIDVLISAQGVDDWTGEATVIYGGAGTGSGEVDDTGSATGSEDTDAGPADDSAPDSPADVKDTDAESADDASPETRDSIVVGASEKSAGCGCAAAPTSTWCGAVVAAVVLARRRRRSGSQSWASHG